MRPPRQKTATRARRAFTLIELMVVVVMISIIAAVVVPMALSRAQRSARPAEEPSLINQAPLEARVVGSAAADSVHIVSSDVVVRLEAAPRLEGADVHTHYRATFRGTFELENRAAGDAPGLEEVEVSFPFPPGMSEARRVRFELVDPDPAGSKDPEERREPPGVTYALDGIRWRGRIATGTPLRAVVSYEAVGRDRFAYDIARNTRTGRIRFEVKLAGQAERAVVPAAALEPTEVRPDAVVWDVEGLIADRPIIVELPAGASPLGRIILMLRFAALAVLLFGAGFWYLSEGVHPGALDGFRWAHFLVLALNYSVFFAVFGVGALVQPPPIALAAAGMISLPLLGVHVARILDARFALTKALPLAVFTLGTVTAAVLLEAHRPVVIVISAVAVLAFVTVTFGSWTRGRKKHGEVQVRLRARRAAAASLEDALSSLGAAIDEQHGIGRRDRALLEESAEDLHAERADVGEAARRVEVELEAARQAREAAAEARSSEPGSLEASDLRALDARLREHEAALKAAVSERGEALARLREAHDDARKALRERQRAERARTEAARTRAGAEATDANAHTHPSDSHCTACGAGSPEPDAAFCTRCGAPRPHVLRCGACGDQLRLPRQVTRKRWTERALHCPSCGCSLLDGPAEQPGPARPEQPGPTDAR